MEHYTHGSVAAVKAAVGGDKKKLAREAGEEKVSRRRGNTPTAMNDNQNKNLHP
jgi:hypothetical protein